MLVVADDYPQLAVIENPPMSEAHGGSGWAHTAPGNPPESLGRRSIAVLAGASPLWIGQTFRLRFSAKPSDIRKLQ